MAARLCETAQSHNAGGVYIVHEEDIPPAVRAGLSELRIREEWMMKLSDRVYKWLKWAALYLLPASGTLYFALASIWGLPYSEQVVGTITAVDTFLGVLLGISTANYNKCR